MTGAERSPFVGLEPNLPVEEILHDTLQHRGQITFAEYMAICLHGEHGYYQTRAQIDQVGAPADFITSPKAHASFGATVANSHKETWESLGKPDDFSIVEMGAHDGTLAKDVLRKLRSDYPDMAAKTHYTLVEQGSGLHQVPQEFHDDERISLVRGSAVTVEMPPITGTVFSNELLDTFPVHRLIRRGDVVFEKYVGLDASGRLVEHEDAVSEGIDLDLHYDRMAEGTEYTVAPQIDTWQKHVAAFLQKGRVITVDYTVDPAEASTWRPRVYSLASEQHTGYPVRYAYHYPGAMDITTSVDFDYVAAVGQKYGLQTRQRITQAEYLELYGFQAEREAIIQAQQPVTAEIRMGHYFASYPLLAADSMGEFAVLVQEKV